MQPENVDAAEFARLAEDLADAQLIDVRTPEEYEQGHLDGAQLVDIMDPDFAERIAELDKQRPCLVYCRSGNRSFHAGMFMKQQGFEKVYNLADGILGWNGAVVTD
mgnify:CR=1 FL=1